MIVITSPVFEEHVPPPGHPERPERAHVFDAIATRWVERGGRVLEPRPATQQELELVHDPIYVERIMATKDKAVMLDPDTFTSPETADIALRAAGSTVLAAEHALDRNEPAFALVRPPGHHAERAKAMGFCFYNNVAVAAGAMLERGLSRIAVVDIDVHHGNGTQWIFYEDPRVLYVSTHQFPFYPGTGAANQTGEAAGKGFTVNVPLEAGCTDADYELVYRSLVVPVLDEFAPQLVLVSAGYDAHERDPLASMRLTAHGYATVVASLHAVARRHGQIALVTEGGYDLHALAECLEASLAVLDGSHVAASGDSGAKSKGPASRAERSLAAVRAIQKPYWRAI
jgi:acetoin utilization deacetylase AcuC-like enzyme